MRADFHISVAPVSISLECPYCDSYIVLDWNNICVPKYGSEDWGTVECLCCGEKIKLGDYEYD